MIADTNLLLRLYWTIDRRADSGTRLTSRVASIVGFVIVVVLSGMVGAFAASLAGDASILQIRAEVLPAILLTVVLFGVVFVGFSQAIQALYLSDDLDKLLVAPVHPQAVMTAKLLSRMPSMVLMLLLATIPALVAFGAVLGLGVFYYTIGVLLTLVTPLFGISLGALVAIFMVRLLPARRLNEWVGAASMIIGVLLSLLIAVPRMFRGNATEIDASTLAAVENLINRFGDLPLPSVWMGRALVEFGRGQIVASALGALGTYLLMTVGLFLVTVLLANRIFLSGWLRMQSSGSQAASVEDMQERPGLFGRNSLDFMLAYKDWLMRVRDPRLLATLFVSVIIAVFLLFSMLRPQEDGSSLFSPTPVEEGTLDLLSSGIIASALIYFMGYMAFYNLSLTSLSIERQAFYILKTAPVSASRVFRAKTFGVYLPYAMLCTIALAVFWIVLKFSLLWTPYAWMVLMIMGYGLYSYLVSLSFLYPKLDWDDPRQMRDRRSGLPALIGSAVYSFLVIILAAITYIMAYNAASWGIPIVIMGLAVMASVTLFFVHWRTNRVEAVWPHIGTD